MANITVVPDLPPLPDYTLSPIPPLLPFISDFQLSLIAPHIAYWVVSLVFHVIDTYDLFPQYRLHTAAEITQRNLASRFEVARDVLVEQVIQMGMTTFLSITEPLQMTGMEDYQVAVWATRVRVAQRALPTLLGLLGLNAATIAKNMSTSHPLLAGALAGGHYPFLTTPLDDMTGTHIPAFAVWELMVAKAIYWILIPAFQVWVATCALDTWQYFWHRAMHVNKWMYSESARIPLLPLLLSPIILSLQDPGSNACAAQWHARHHRLYVPYAYGALYNHPVEGFLLDTLGAGVAYKLSLMSPRLGMFFFVGSTVKTVDDHCGYALPWDPLQHITSNNAAYHDIHHQSWGIKTNFSQPFFTIWDRLLGTMWKGDTSLKYERTRAAAENKGSKAQ